ncbi:MAG: methyltransferase domain-containing protein [Nitrososphaerales archaeon]
MPLKLALICEGETELYVPSQSLGGGPPDTHPVFYNPAARTNRDISVAVAVATGPKTFLDVLAGTGARGLRVAKEAGSRTHVTLADFSTPSLAVARRNTRRNRLVSRCTVVHEEANRYLASRFERQEKFDAIDIDPFGSPAPFVQAATVAASDGGVVSMTATDAAVLCGVYPDVSYRRYGALAVRSEFVHETGLRILLGFAARIGGINDVGIEPIAAHSTLHYLRVFFRVRKGATKAENSVRALGFVTQCNGCNARDWGPAPLDRCKSCGTRVRSSGPLWTGKVVDEEVVAGALGYAEGKGWKEAEETLAPLRGLDRFPPFSYSPERVCSRLKIPSVPVRSALDVLTAAGFTALRQPFEENGIKTDARYEEFVEALKTVSRTSA